jgi:hypothetical protein
MGKLLARRASLGFLLGALLIAGLGLATATAPAIASNIANVLIANTAANPVPVNVVKPRPEPVQGHRVYDQEANRQDACGNMYSVPAGKRLTIEWIDISVFNQGPSATSLYISATGFDYPFQIPLIDQPTQAYPDNYPRYLYAMENVQIFVDGGQTVRCAIEREDPGVFGRVALHWSGHLEDMP